MIGKFNEVSEVAKERTSLKDSPLGKMEPVKDFMPRGDYDPPPWKRSDPIFGGEWKDLLLRQEDAQKHFAERMETRNQDLEGKEHPETGVPFEKKIVKNDKGEDVEVVVPKFDSKFDVQLPEELEKASDKEQITECNKQLKDAVENDPDLKEQFTDEQLEQIMDGETPDGYTWHHDAEKGKMQLVDSETHARTGHTGGRVIWGGGQSNR